MSIIKKLMEEDKKIELTNIYMQDNLIDLKKFKEIYKLNKEKGKLFFKINKNHLYRVEDDSWKQDMYDYIYNLEDTKISNDHMQIFINEENNKKVLGLLYRLTHRKEKRIENNNIELYENALLKAISNGAVYFPIYNSNQRLSKKISHSLSKKYDISYTYMQRKNSPFSRQYILYGWSDDDYFDSINKLKEEYVEVDE